MVPAHTPSSMKAHSSLTRRACPMLWVTMTIVNRAFAFGLRIDQPAASMRTAVIL
jgi:hypothetical protein